MSDSDDVPLARRLPVAAAVAAAPKKRKPAEAGPSSVAKRAKKPAAAKPVPSDDEDDDDDDDDAGAAEKKAAKDRKVVEQSTRVKKGAKKARHDQAASGHCSAVCSGQVWDTLSHNGVTFPPPYEPHGVKLLYAGKPVDLSAEEEEVRQTSAR